MIVQENFKENISLWGKYFPQRLMQAGIDPQGNVVKKLLLLSVVGFLDACSYL